MMRNYTLLSTIAIAILLSACSKASDEKSSSGIADNSTLSGGKYQGKPDTHPWDNDPVKFAAVKQEKGNKAAWEQQLKVRNQAQNDYSRAE
jgi:major membrane immunogen (membrane-anchored lipoprotein)